MMYIFLMSTNLLLYVLTLSTLLS